MSEHHMLLHGSVDARNPDGTWTRITQVFCRTEDKVVWAVTDTFREGETPPSRVREAMAVAHDPRCEAVLEAEDWANGELDVTCDRMAGHTGKHRYLFEWGEE